MPFSADIFIHCVAGANTFWKWNGILLANISLSFMMHPDPSADFCQTLISFVTHFSSFFSRVGACGHENFPAEFGLQFLFFTSCEAQSYGSWRCSPLIQTAGPPPPPWWSTGPSESTSVMCHVSCSRKTFPHTLHLNVDGGVTNATHQRDESFTSSRFLSLH